MLSEERKNKTTKEVRDYLRKHPDLTAIEAVEDVCEDFPDDEYEEIERIVFEMEWNGEFDEE
jgi:hypothetical protein